MKPAEKVLEWMKKYYEVNGTPNYGEIIAQLEMAIEEEKKCDIVTLSKEHLTRSVWDGFLTAEWQDEHWRDEDTCRLIVQKILTNEEIEHAKGNLP